MQVLPFILDNNKFYTFFMVPLHGSIFQIYRCFAIGLWLFLTCVHLILSDPFSSAHVQDWIIFFDYFGLFPFFFSSVPPSLFMDYDQSWDGSPVLFSWTIVACRHSLSGQFFRFVMVNPFAQRYDMCLFHGQFFQNMNYAYKSFMKNAPSAESKVSPMKRTFLGSAYYLSGLEGPGQ